MRIREPTNIVFAPAAGFQIEPGMGSDVGWVSSEFLKK
jgi:hypothetical protein